MALRLDLPPTHPSAGHAIDAELRLYSQHSGLSEPCGGEGLDPLSEGVSHLRVWSKNVKPAWALAVETGFPWCPGMQLFK